MKIKHTWMGLNNYHIQINRYTRGCIDGSRSGGKIFYTAVYEGRYTEYRMGYFNSYTEAVDFIVDVYKEAKERYDKLHVPC